VEPAEDDMLREEEEEEEEEEEGVGAGAGEAVASLLLMDYLRFTLPTANPVASRAVLVAIL
jgi:hypothetical protein